MKLKLKDNILTINGEAYKLVPVEEQQVQKKARTGWERVEEGEMFYHLGRNMKSCPTTECLCSLDKEMYKKGNSFSDQQLCDDVGRAVSIYLRMLRWQAENDVPVDIHNPSTAKWCISYDSSDKELYATYGKNLLGTFEVFFSTNAKAQECVKVFKDDLIWLHTQFFRRLDERGEKNGNI